MKRFFNARSFLIIIVLLAFFLRFYKVTENPPSLNWDEVSIGYNAYSILKTGKDEWGKTFPLHFRAYGEYKLPAQIYASIPGVMLFGLTEIGVRITPVLYGTLTVLLLYFLAFEIFKDKRISLASSFLLAISPWHIHLTRASFESSFSVLWVVLGICLMLKSLHNPKLLKWPLLSVISFVIGIYTYNSARVFIPVFLLINFFIYRKEFLKSRKNLLVSILLFIVLLLPLIPFSLSGDVADRYKLVSILTDPGLVPRIDQARNLSRLPSLLTKAVHNRYTYSAVYFVTNYLAHFTPDFLFINGAPHKQHHVQGVGQMYLVQAPFVLLGLYFLFMKKFKYRWLILSWILLGIIPVSITRDSIPHALRTLIVAPAYMLLTAYGFVLMTDSVKKRKAFVVGLTSITLLMGFISYMINFYDIYPYLYSRDWQYGYSQVVSYIKDHYNEYDQIVFSRGYGEPHMFTLFYLGWDPQKYQNDPNLVRYQSNDWVWVTNFDKFYFPDLGDKGTDYKDIIKKYPNKKLLFIGKPEDFPAKSIRLKEVDFLNGKDAFEIVEYR